MSGSVDLHLQERYGIEAASVVGLDVGVFRIDRRDGPSWVARVFPAERAVDDVEAEAELLSALEGGGFPAERLAHDEPVSGWGEQSVLVTEFVVPAAPLKPGRSAALLGALLGVLHSRPGTRFRSGGAWHHLSLTGGPRVWSLGFLLWAAGARHPRLVELAVSRYRKRVSLEPEELARLEGAISGRPLMLDCWSFCHGRLSLAQIIERLDADRELAKKIAAQARQAFAAT